MFVPTKEACRILQIHPNTLRKLAKEKKIDFIKVSKTHHLYNVEKFIEESLAETRIR